MLNQILRMRFQKAIYSSTILSSVDVLSVYFVWESFVCGKKHETGCISFTLTKLIVVIWQ